MKQPTLRIKKTHAASILRGCPWVMRHQAVESSEWMAALPGSLVRVETERGEFIGTGVVNPLSQIVCRMLSWQREAIDAAFFTRLITQALEKRTALYDAPYYRLVHAEADGLPGLVIDRFDDVLVAQVGSHGMEKLQPIWLVALEHLLEPRSVVMRNDFSARKLEGLVQEVKVIKGSVPEYVTLTENGCIYSADVLSGQKTGWFYDMRDNRKMLAGMAEGKTMLDVFSHSGGFGLLAATQGACDVTMVDSSALALDLAMRAAAENGVASRSSTIRGDALEVMRRLASEGRVYDLVVADPPAYVKSKKDIASGLKGYEKVAAQAAMLVEKGGHFFTATCSHHAGRSAFNKAVLSGIAQAGRAAEIIRQTGAGSDHPLHPHLPQSEYLKGLLLRLN
ncbi:MAG: class I SAM-dependent rRNA methyltransferase [Alphaproteobacteria bacterium]|nr:class I SAM-dependent rRNA methyltransferase [Alphaproteobacteria bacterium]